jgi:hypothetical protein
MQTVVSPRQMERGGTADHEAMSARVTTTLYALCATIQEVVGPEDDMQVVATLVHLVHSGRLTWLEQAEAPLDLAGRVVREEGPRGSSQATARRPRAMGPASERTPPHAPQEPSCAGVRREASAGHACLTPAGDGPSALDHPPHGRTLHANPHRSRLSTGLHAR